MTADGYSSRAIDSFMLLTIHYTTQDFQYRNYTLCIKNLEERHTSVNLNEFLKNELIEWGLHEETLQKVFITDNAANMICCISISKDWIRVPCFDHTLQLALKDVENEDEELNVVVAKAKKIVAYFRRSTHAAHNLTDIQKTIYPDAKPLCLIQHVETRWNSKHDMFKRLSQLRRPLGTALAERGTPDNFTNEEWEIIDLYVKVLGPVKQITTIMEGEKYTTLSSYIPMIRGLEDVLDHDYNLSRHENDFSEKYLLAIKERFEFVKGNKTFVLSMMIDPRYKDRFVNQLEKEQVYNILYEKTNLLSQHTNSTKPPDDALESRRDAVTGKCMKAIIYGKNHKKHAFKRLTC